MYPFRKYRVPNVQRRMYAPKRSESLAQRQTCGFMAIYSGLLAFVTWTLTSYACHQLGKIFLQRAELALTSEQVTHDLITFCLAGMLTALQMVMCYLLTIYNSESQKEETPSQHSVRKNIAYRIAMATHVISTLLTNWSLARMEAASTLAIKLMEPVVSALAQRMWSGQPLSTITWCSLPLVVGGSLVFSSDGTNVDHVITTGVALAMLSNVVLAVRNLAIKHLYGGDFRVSIVSSRKVVFMAILSLTAICGAFVLEVKGQMKQGSMLTLGALLLSSIFHVCYSVVSTGVVLRMLDVVSHAVANISKRVLVVMLLYVSGTRHASSVNVMGLAAAGAGLALYVHEKTATQVTYSQWISNFPMAKRRRIFLYGMLVLLGTLGSISTAFYVQPRMLSTSGLSAFVNLIPYDLQKENDDLESVRRVAGLASNVNMNSGCNYTSGIYWPKEPPNSSLLREWEEFLSLDLTQQPFETDRLAGRMHTNDEVVWAAQRLHMNMLRSLLGGRRYVMLMEIAIYENKGDPAITAGEITLLRHLNVSVVFSCDTYNCNNDTLAKAKTISRQYSPETLVILMQGGGNLVGYAFNDGIRKQILNMFPEFPAILFSQSIWVHKDNQVHLKKCEKIYSNRPNLTIYLRDRQSLELARKHFKGTQLVLMPDMAFCIGRVPRFMPPIYDILWLKRSDRESSKYTMPTMPGNISLHVSDWWDWKTNKGTKPMETSILMTFNGLLFLQRGRVVITDRLHGHILSTLAGIPHVLIDNPPYLKLSSFRKSWTAGLKNTVMVTSGEEALHEARQMLVRYGDRLPPVLPYMESAYGKK